MWKTLWKTWLDRLQVVCSLMLFDACWRFFWHSRAMRLCPLCAVQGTQMLRQAILQPSAKLPEIQKRHAAVEVHRYRHRDASWHIVTHRDTLMWSWCDHELSCNAVGSGLWSKHLWDIRIIHESKKHLWMQCIIYMICSKMFKDMWRVNALNFMDFSSQALLEDHLLERVQQLFGSKGHHDPILKTCDPVSR